MSLCNLTTPFERRRVIEYGADGNKVVRHWYEMQHVIGPLYKSRDAKNEWDEIIFTMFIFFPGVTDGFAYWKNIRFPERYTAEHLLSSLEHDGYSTKEQAIATLNKCVECGTFIGGAWIEFVRQFDSERADCYAKYRTEFYARRAEEEKKQADMAAEEEAKKTAERQAELEKVKANYFGWADSMTALRFGKVRAQMEKQARFNGKVMSYREFIIQCVKDGWIPQRKDNVITRKASKPKTAYMLKKDGFYYEVSKTEFDFAMYLTEHKERQL